jgi:hypothetical protein
LRRSERNSHATSKDIGVGTTARVSSALGGSQPALIQQPGEEKGWRAQIEHAELACWTQQASKRRSSGLAHRHPDLDDDYDYAGTEV